MKRFQLAAIATLGYPLINALGHTLRWRVDGLHHLDAIAVSGRRPVMAFWHGRILPATFYFRRRGIVVITSEHFDGEWIARIIHRFGYGTARGSSSHGGAGAMRGLIRNMRQGKTVGFAIDGPRGPARVAQSGALWLARASGNPVLPFHLEAAHHWTLGSWDRTQIPKPFSMVALAVGAPLTLSRGAGDAEADEARRDLEARLYGLEHRAVAMLR